MLWLFSPEELEDGVAISEIQLPRTSTDELTEAFGFEPPPDRRPGQSAIPGDVNRILAVKRLRLIVDVVSLVRHSVPHEASFTVSIRGLPAFASASMSASTIIRASSSVFTVAFQPSFVSALDASPTSASTSVGRR